MCAVMNDYRKWVLIFNYYIFKRFTQDVKMEYPKDLTNNYYDEVEETLASVGRCFQRNHWNSTTIVWNGQAFCEVTQFGKMTLHSWRLR